MGVKGMSAIDRKALVTKIGVSNHERLFQFVATLRRRAIVGSYEVSRHTAEFYRSLISSSHWSTPEEAIAVIHQLGNILTAAQPNEHCLGNITHRGLFFIRDAQHQEQKTQDTTFTSLQDLLVSSDGIKRTGGVEFKKLKSIVLEEINHLLEELDGLHQSIVNQALDHIHANEIIMTYGRSNTVVKFLKEAGRKRKFNVVIPEAAPLFRGKQTAKELAEAGIDSTLIPDSAIFCMMSRVNKVVVGTNAVLANGGLLAMSGVRMLAEAAKYYSVPFVVISGMYKLSPVYPRGKDFFNDLSSPCNVISFEELDNICRDNPHGVDVLNPSLDYIPPELVSLYLTNYGVHSPSYIYRMLAEYYSLADYSFALSYSEELIEVQGILSLPEGDMIDALSTFLEENPSFDLNQKVGDKTLLEYLSATQNPQIAKLIHERSSPSVSVISS